MKEIDLEKTNHQKENKSDAQKLKQALDFIKEGNLKQAEIIYRRMIYLGCKNYLVYGNLAAICGLKGNKDEMLELLKTTLKINPSYPDAHNNMGIVLKEKGVIEEAIICYKKAIQLKPNYPQAYNNLGTALQAKGVLMSAILCYKKAIKLQARFPEAYFNLGNAFFAEKKINSAIKAFEKAIGQKPNYPEAYSNLGNAYKETNELTKAINSYKQALQLKPNYSDAYCNLGMAYQLDDDLDEAINCYNKALEIKPNHAGTINNLGIAMEETGDLFNANYLFKKAIQIDPNFPEAYYNLGHTLIEQNQISLAITSYKKAIELNPSYSEAHWNLSLAELLAGDYEAGWKNYHWRWKKPKAIKAHAEPKSLRWEGELLAKNERLLVVTEQGLGDTLQYMRYIPYLRNQGINVSFCAQTKLHTIIKASKIDPDPLSPDNGNSSIGGKWTPLLSIPMYLGVTKKNPLISEPYIFPKEALIKKWENLLSKESDPIIGINWQGNPKLEKERYKGRSIPLETFSILFNRNRFKILSLQKGFGSEQLETCSFKEKFVTCQKEINSSWDFHDNAAIIANCDLIITCDTVVAHLAGGMGKPVWLLLRDVPFWTWGLNGKTTFWYQSMQLFRQKERDNWKELMERVGIKLNQFLQNRS